MLNESADLPLARGILAATRAHTLKIKQILLTKGVGVPVTEALKDIDNEVARFDAWMRGMEQELWPKKEK